MARPRKPTAVKRLQGTLQPCRTNTAEPIPQNDLIGAPPPEFLSRSAKAVWTFALSQVPPGMLSTVDYSLFSEWVVLYDQFVELTKELKKNSSIIRDEDGIAHANPLVGSLTKLAAALKGIQTELGFTPASRSKITTFGGDKDGKDNKFSEVM